MDRNGLLTLISYIYFSMAVIHFTRVIFGADISFFGISLPYIVSILIGIGISYLGWKSLSFRG